MTQQQQEIREKLKDFNYQLLELKKLVDANGAINNLEQINNKKEICNKQSNEIIKLIKQSQKSNSSMIQQNTQDAQKIINFYGKLCNQIKLLHQKQLDAVDEGKLTYYQSLEHKIKSEINKNQDQMFDENGNKISDEFYNEILRINEKNQAIQEIQNEVSIIYSMMNEINDMTNTQGVKMDAIEMNIQTTKKQVNESHKDLIDGKKYSQSNQKWYCSILILGLIILMIIIFTTF